MPQSWPELYAPVTHPTRTAAGERPAFSGPPGAIAVVGMSGRYPGANGLAAYWRNLSTGRRSVGTHVPARAVTPGPAVTGGFLDGVDDFDSLLFHIAPAEAATLDPQLRVLLPVVWECLEEAGYTPAALQRAAGRVGVFVGVMWQDHQQVGADLWRRTGAATHG